jgi:hypothetical protein
VPKLSAGTRRPEWPRRLYSKILLLSGLRSQQASRRAAFTALASVIG